MPGFEGRGGWPVRRSGQPGGGRWVAETVPWAIGPKRLTDYLSRRLSGDWAVVIALHRSVP
jgi:hypothetical protein